MEKSPQGNHVPDVESSLGDSPVGADVGDFCDGVDTGGHGNAKASSSSWTFQYPAGVKGRYVTGVNVFEGSEGPSDRERVYAYP